MKTKIELMFLQQIKEGNYSLEKLQQHYAEALTELYRLKSAQSPSGETLEAANLSLAAQITREYHRLSQYGAETTVTAIMDLVQQTGKPSEDTLRVQQNKQLHYWKQRCEAAEHVIAISGVVDCEGYDNWQSLKQDK